MGMKNVTVDLIATTFISIVQWQVWLERSLRVSHFDRKSTESSLFRSATFAEPEENVLKNHQNVGANDFSQVALSEFSKTKLIIARVIALVLKYLCFYASIFLLVPLLIAQFELQIFDSIIAGPFGWQSLLSDSKPSDYGLTGYAIRVSVDGSSYANMWYLPPASNEASEIRSYKEFEMGLLQTNQTVFYVHGNSDTKSTEAHGKRIKKFVDGNYTVIACHTRGGGSTFGSHVDVVAACFKWFLRKSPNRKIFAWGHSIGANILAVAMKRLKLQGGNFVPPIVLESPYPDAESVLSRNIVFKLLFSWLPDSAFVTAFHEAGIDKFNVDLTAKDLQNVQVLCANDDVVVPVKTCEDVVKRAKNVNVYLEKKPTGGREILLSSTVDEVTRTFANFASTTNRPPHRVYRRTVPW